MTRNHIIGTLAAGALVAALTGCTGDAGAQGSGSSTAPAPRSTDTQLPLDMTTAPVPAPTETTPSTSSPQPTGSLPPAPAGSGGCTKATTEMAVTTVPGSGAAGHYSLRLAVKNTGTMPCTLQGFPGLQLLRAAKGPALGAPATRTQDAVTAVALAPGDHASAEIQVTQAANVAGCTRTPAAALQVILPDTKDPAVVALPNPVDGCVETGVSLLQVKPFGGR